MAFDEFAREWVERYQGRGKGLRESTRDGYRVSLERFAIPRFGRKPLAASPPRSLAGFVEWLSAKGLSGSTVRNIVTPVRSPFATATREGLLRVNPAAQIAFPRASG